MLSVASLLATTLAIVAVANGHDWSYNNLDWQGLCHTGKEQSPIDLRNDIAVAKEFSRFIFKNYTTAILGDITNNGHSITVKFHDSKARIEGGGLSEEYTLDHFHFHWGSEHTVKGKRFPLEMHLVHYATRLKNVANAIQHRGGVAVLGVLFQLSPEDDDEFNELNDAMESVLPKVKTTTQSRKLAPNSFVPRDTAGYYRYHGSLTTPDCNEGVIWTVFTNTIPISQHQVDLFQKYKTDDGSLEHNYRPVQPLNQRTLFFKESPIGSGMSKSTASAFAILFATILFAVL